MFVKPKNSETVVRDPQTRALLPADGRNVPDSTFWRRRLADGDVVEAEPAKKPSADVETSAPARPKKEA